MALTPMIQLYTSDPTLENSNAIGYILTDHNRQSMNISYEVIENAARMANGTMRKFITANKKNMSTSWQDLPSAAGYPFTSDSNLGAAFIKSFYEENVYNPVWIKLTYSEEAWKFANDTPSYSMTSPTNSSFDTTVNMLNNNPFTDDIKRIAMSPISSGSAYGIIVTPNRHNISDGEEIFITGINTLFNGTWKTFSNAIGFPYTYQVLEDNPSLFLEFNNGPTSIIDSSGNVSASNITIAGILQDAEGLFNVIGSGSGTIQKLSGGGQINVAHSSLPSFSHKFSLEFWMKSTAGIAGGGQASIYKYDFTSPHGFYVTRHDDTLVFNVACGISLFTTITIPNAFNNAWNHWVMTADDTSGYTVINVYKNGILVSTDGSLNASGFGTTTNFTVYSDPSRGYIDNVAIYSTILTIDQIALHYYLQQNYGNPSYTIGFIMDSINLNLNSYTTNVSENSGTFNVDSVDMITANSTFNVYGYKPLSGAYALDADASSWTITSTTSSRQFTASYGSISHTGYGIYGDIKFLSSPSVVMKDIAWDGLTTRVGKAVASDIIKVFMSDFTYDIKKRFQFTDIVDISIKFTEI